jgi:hypothetical protein
MRADLRRKTKNIYFKIINATAKASGGQYSNDNGDYIIEGKKPAALSLLSSNYSKSRYRR